MYLYFWLLSKDFRDFSKNKIRYKKLNSEEIVRYSNRSKVVIDIQLPNQEGLTMRTFETLAMSKKLITTNSEIKKYEFYNPNNICVINRQKIDIPDNFFKSKFQSLKDDFYKEYSISYWLQILLGGEND